MNQAPRIPYGMAKKIVATMNVLDHCIVRPEWVVAFHNAARRLGLRLAAVSFHRKGKLLFRMLRVEGNWPTGHLVQRQPRREQVSGRFRKREAA